MKSCEAVKERPLRPHQDAAAGARPPVSRAHLVSLTVFLAFAAEGMAGLFAMDTIVPGIAIFLGAGFVGSILSAKLFDRLSTPDERQRDLEDRVRNSDL